MKMEKSVKLTGIIIIGVIIVSLIVVFGSRNSSSTQNTVSVSGQSSLEVMPDLVGIYFNIDTKGVTSKEAADANSEISNGLTNSLIALGFEKEQIQTQSYSVYPEYDWKSGTGRIIDYMASHAIKLELSTDNSEQIADVLDAGINAGAGISYINFELSQENQNTYKAQAIKIASKDATTKAEAVAEGLNKKLGSLVSVSVDNYNYYPWLVRDFSGASTAEIEQAAPSIQPSNQEITASITAVFKIR